MNHLTIVEILEFITCKTLDDNSEALIKKVNSHILRCDECLMKVREYQSILDPDNFNDIQDEEQAASLWQSETDVDGEDPGVFGSR